MSELIDFEEHARAVLTPHVSAYYAAAADSGVGLDQGTAAWSAVRFRQRVLRGVDSSQNRLANLAAAEQAAAGPAGIAGDPSINFDTIGWLRELSGLPVVVKGVLHADDARRCVDAGAAGVVVSTHGGRRIGPTISSAPRHGPARRRRHR
jgi:isopentenyl diphosphate isomerase/L-lactate dehydrogenase-like FMN-dependent dehydrogenase